MVTVRVAWDEQADNVLHYYFESRWNWDDAYQAYHQAHSLIEAKSKPIGVVLSGPDNMILPPNLLTHTRKLMTSKKSQHTKLIVFVSNSLFVRTMANILTKLVTTELHTTTDLDAARKLVSKRLEAASGKLED